MTDYLEYTKGGYILIAPSVDYKHQYILKCFMCDDYYGDFEPFLSHCFSHNEEIFCDNISNASSSMERLYSAEVEKVEEDEYEDNEALHDYTEVEVCIYNVHTCIYRNAHLCKEPHYAGQVARLKEPSGL